MQRRRQAEALASATVVGALPTLVNLTLYQGDDFYLRINVTGTGVNLTGYTAKADIKSSPGSGAVIATFAATITSSTQVDLHLTAVQAALVPATAAWDVQVTDPTGVITTLAYGSVTSMRQVTT